MPDALAEREEMIPAQGMTRQRGPRPGHCAQCVHHCTPRLALASLFPTVTLPAHSEALRDGWPSFILLPSPPDF